MMLNGACSRRSDSAARKKNSESRKRNKTRKDWGKSASLPSLYSFFLRSQYFSFARHYLNAWNKQQCSLIAIKG